MDIITAQNNLIRAQQDYINALISSGAESSITNIIPRSEPSSVLRQSRTITFQEYYSEWIKKKEREVKPTTYAGWLCSYPRRILPEVGDMPLDSIDAEIMQQLCDKWHNEGLCNKGIRDLKGLITNVYNSAVRDKICEKKDFTIIYPQDIMRSEVKKIATKEDIQKLYKAAHQDIFERNKDKKLKVSASCCKWLGLMIMVYTGIRIGELCFLRWEHINTTRNIISIRGTRYRTALGKSGEGAPKSKTSTRDIPIHSQLKEFICEMECDYEKNMYIATGMDKGTEPRTFRIWYKRELEKLGIEYFSPHALRHTFISNAINNGANIKTISELAGHAETGITLNTYYHTDEDIKAREIEKLLSTCKDSEFIKCEEEKNE